MSADTPNPSESDIKALLDRVVSGDPEAVEELVVAELPWIKDRVRKRVGSALRANAETQDYAQSCLIQILKQGPSLKESSRDQFRALCIRIIENRLRDKAKYLNAKKRDFARNKNLLSDSVLNLAAAQTGPGTPASIAAHQEELRLIRLGVELLDEKDHEVLVLRDWEDAPWEGIGRTLGISEDAARMRHKRALAKLEQVLSELRAGNIDRAITASES